MVTEEGSSARHDCVLDRRSFVHLLWLDDNIPPLLLLRAPTVGLEGAPA